MGFDRSLSAAALLQVPLPLLLLLLPVFYIAAALMLLVCYYTALHVPRWVGSLSQITVVAGVSWKALQARCCA
jgi:hypothetical protein